MHSPSSPLYRAGTGSLAFLLVLAAQPGTAPGQAAGTKPAPAPSSIVGASGQGLVGQPAPAFSTTDLAGRPVVLEQYRGRVVLLDFWAMYCAPCVRALPEIQRIADAFAKQPVTVIGINRDPPGAEFHVRRLLERDKIAFPQIMDAGGEVSRKFGVRGLPCHVLIDARGVVQEWQMGYGPTYQAHVVHQIGRLLAGESLVTAGQTATRRAGDGVIQPAPASTELPSHDPRRLAPRSSLDDRVQAFNSRWFDVDGDGAQELILPSWQGGVVIVDAAGSTAREIRFEGLSGVLSFEPLVIDGGLHWAVARGAYRGPLGGGGPFIGLFDPGGKPAWSHDPGLGPDDSATVHLAVGDVDNDSVPEILVGLSVYRMQGSPLKSNPAARQGHLLIFDRGGRLLCSRRIGDSVGHVHVAPASAAGGAPAVVVVSDGRIQRFSFE